MLETVPDLQARARRERDVLEAQLDAALLESFGLWVSGWNWATSEPGGGGPVRAWCCASHSILAEGETSAAATIDRVVAAVTEWHAFIHELDRVFGDLRARTANFELARKVEHAAATLVALVIERTGAEDAWYGTFATLLQWFLESCGIEDTGDAIVAATRGRFESWLAPAPETVAATTAELGRTIATRDPPPVRDELALWLANRHRSLEGPLSLPRGRVVAGDAHARFIATRDRDRDPARARRMTAALDACRASARAGDALTFERLASWQALVLGTIDAPPLRTTDAFARDGAVRYAYAPDLDAHVRSALADANRDEPATLRAARVFLDICFMHPFADGNGRAARLALDHVLTRAGLALHAVEPVFVIARSADDESGGYRLARMIEMLTGPLA
ncbi:MAG: Fic family protein [Kofleriaceae bacterium]|nr:Fic family protein [Kofleriaceae bacterium]